MSKAAGLFGLMTIGLNKSVRYRIIFDIATML